jgi:hypothetical protein
MMTQKRLRHIAVGVWWHITRAGHEVARSAALRILGRSLGQPFGDELGGKLIELDAFVIS